jgi:hypothetical protein
LSQKSIKRLSDTRQTKPNNLELGGNFGEFTARLECQAQKYSLGDFKESLMADRVVIGVQSDSLREKVLLGGTKYIETTQSNGN